MRDTSNHFVQKSTWAQRLRQREDLIYKKNSREQDCGDTTKISDVQKPNLLLQNETLDPIGDAMWPTVMP